MGNPIELTAADGHELAAYLAQPRGAVRGGVVVIQEIFGVTSHIRDVADRFAAAGYLSIAPALFDRVERDVEVPYSDMARGRHYKQAVSVDQAMLDVAAAAAHVRAGQVGVVGYCWGGTLAYLAAARLPIDAAVAFYGGEIARYSAEAPRVPIMYHFGEKDAHIPMSVVEQIKTAHPEGTFYAYPADHGFNCTDRASFEPASAALALERTVEFLQRHIG